MKLTGRCNLRTAIYFCLHRVPWMLLQRIDCQIYLPPKSVIVLFSELELYIGYYNVAYNNSSTESAHYRNMAITVMSISIFGGGSSVRRLSSRYPRIASSLLVPVDLRKSQVYVNLDYAELTTNRFNEEINNSESQQIMKLIFSMKNVTLQSFDSDLTGDYPLYEAKDVRLGGCLHLQWFHDINLEYLRIESFNSQSAGGAIVISKTATVRISQVKITRCSSFNGAGIVLSDVGKVNIIDSTFEANAAFNIGGGLLIDTADVVKIVNCTFTRNIVAKFGGAISINAVANALAIENSTFRGNLAQYGSGWRSCEQNTNK